QVDLRGRGGRLADPQRVAIRLDVVVRPAGLDAGRVVLGVPSRDRRGASLAEEEPLLALVVLEGAGRGVIALAATAARPHGREPALELLAVEAEFELAARDGGPRIDRGRLGLPGAPIPDDDVAGAVLAGRDHALEVEILDRVVLDVDGHPSDAGVERRAAGYRP